MNSKIGLIPRKAAWDVLQAVASGAYSDMALDRVIRNYSLSDSDRALATELAYGSIRQRYFLDCWIDFLGKVPARKQPPKLRWLLHVGLYQILKMKNIPSSAAINTTVELAKSSSFAKLAPVVNAILRSTLRVQVAGKSFPLADNVSKRLAQEKSVPIWLAKDLIQWKGEKVAQTIAESFNKYPSLDLRVNSIRSDIFSLKSKFDSLGIKSKCIPNCPYGIEVDLGKGNIRDLPGFDKGEWSVQDRSSQLIAPLLNPKVGDRILDACAAPGGKTTHIAEMLKNQGEVWAVDSSSKRLQRLTINSKRLGTFSINTFSGDSTQLLTLKPEWENYFDKILLDAPCSGLGTLARNPDARWRINPIKIKGLVMLQYNLLKAMIPLLKKGGQLVYSTCTFHPDENTKQISNFLKEFPPFRLLKERQIWPNQNVLGDGFYSVLLEYLK